MSYFKDVCICGMSTCQCGHLDKPVIKNDNSSTVLVNKKLWEQMKEKLKQAEDKIDELSWDGALNRVEEKLKQVESELLAVKNSKAKSQKNRNSWKRRCIALEKIARKGFEMTAHCLHEKSILKELKDYHLEQLKKIDELVGKNAKQ